jgi:hypothetical protein
VHRAANPNVSFTMLPGVAPSAIRTPISRRRCATRNPITPLSPIAASSTPMAANAPNNVAWNRGRPVLRANRSRMVVISTGSVGSSDANNPRSDDAASLGSTYSRKQNDATRSDRHVDNPHGGQVHLAVD